MKFLEYFQNDRYVSSEEESFTPTYHILKGNNETMVKVIDKDRYDDFMPYLVEFIDGNTCWVTDNKFQRYMTDDEIKEFEEEKELRKETNKYNL